MSSERTGLSRLRLELRRTSDDPALRKYLLGWIGPALFALLVSATIRVHSLAPPATMPYVVANLLALSAIGFAVLLAKGYRLNVSRDAAFLLLALAAAAVISVLGSEGIGLSLLRLELYLAVVLFATVIYLVYRDQQTLPLQGYLLGIAAVHLPFLFAAVRWIGEMEPPFWDVYGLRLADFAHVRQFAEFAFLAAVSATALGLLSPRWLIPSFVMATSALFGIILTGSRGALLCWMLFVVLACFLGPARLRAALHGLLALGVSASLVWYLDQTALLPSPNLFARIATQSVGEETFDSSRLQVWWQSLQQIFARPLFGSGPEGYWLSGCCDRRILQAHNFVLQFLLEFGVIGCGIVVLLAARACKSMGGVIATAKLALISPDNRTLACVLAAFLAYSLIDQMLYHLLPLLHFGLFAGLFAAGISQARAAANRERRPERG